MTGRIFEAGHTTAPDHMPDRAQDTTCINGGVHTRPLFPYPYTAAYDGTGDPDDAGSFVRSEDAIGFTALDWAGSIFFAPYDPREI